MQELALDFSASEEVVLATKPAITDQSSSETGLIGRRGRRPYPSTKKLERCVYWLKKSDRVAFDKMYEVILKRDER